MITSSGPAGRLHSRRTFRRHSPMWIFLLEAGVALALLLFILWWTLPRKEKDASDTEPPKALTDKKDDHDRP